jgi:hypothetical protein
VIIAVTQGAFPDARRPQILGVDGELRAVRRANRAASYIGAMNPSLSSHIADLLANTPKISVVKELRAQTGFPLDTALKYCKAVESRAFLRDQVPPEFGGGSLAARIRLLQSGGDALTALRLVQDETGMTEPEATRFLGALDLDAG